MREIDLGELTRHGEVHNLSGHDRGLAAREQYGLAEIDRSGDVVRVTVPEDVYTLTPSFFQGMFASSVQATGGDRDRFLDRFRFNATPLVLQQVDRGITAVRTRRQEVLTA